jgi:uncharacterized protein YggU (UPF0235/DUF167 family)
VLKVRVRAAPQDGEANAALIALVAKALSATKKAIAIRAGETSRIKKLFIAGDPATLIDALARLAQKKDQSER